MNVYFLYLKQQNCEYWELKQVSCDITKIYDYINMCISINIGIEFKIEVKK